MPKIGLSDMLPIIQEAFSKGKSFRLPITGTSMNPLLYQGRDYVEIVKPQLPLSLGDIPLYRRNNGDFVLHRVVKIKENGEYVMCGDNQFLLESGITDSNIIGVVKTIVRDGREFSAESDPWYISYKTKYLKNINTRYPVRRVKYFLYRKLKSGSKTSAEVSKEQANKQQIEKDILQTGEILIAALKSQLNAGEYDFPDGTDFKKLYILAQSHRIVPLVASQVLKSDKAPEDIKNAFKKETFKTSFRYNAQSKENSDISAEFSKEGIAHCFLKGGEVAEYYDNPDLRFMLDADLFVQTEKFAVAEKILIERGYVKSADGDDKDVLYTKPPFFNIELHKELKYDYDKGYDYYKGAFDRMEICDGSRMKMTNEDFYVYILSHTAHHFEVAGTGIKSIVDHWYLKNKLKPICNPEILSRSLNDIGLGEFEKNISSLCECWFGDKQPDEITNDMSDYIILSGVFGNSTNQYISGILRGDYGVKKSEYFISRLFPKYDIMKIKYPVLKKVSFLLPLFWIIRLLESVFSFKRITSETKSVAAVGAKSAQVQAKFFENVGL